MIPLHYLATVPLFFSTFFLWTPQGSTSALIVLWLLRVVTFSMLFRSFLGPTILRLISRRLRVQSVSLRSIRGIYFRTGNRILHVDRVGLSYHRPNAHGASRFSIRVEGLKLELLKPERPERRKATSRQTQQSAPKSKLSQFAPSPLARRVWKGVCFASTRAYCTLEPYARPVLRASVVWALRLAIRALPALTQVLDLEVDDAAITSPEIPGAELVVRTAKFHTSVAFTQLDNSVADARPPPAAQPNHRRFASVADLNTRIKNSFRRTWDRAWGSTQVAASLSLSIQSVTGIASEPLVNELKCSVFGDHTFLIVPEVLFETSVRLDPAQKIESHGLDISLGTGSISVDMEVVQLLLEKWKELRRSREPQIATIPPLSSAISVPTTTPISSPPLSPRASRIGWSSPLSPASPLMEVLAVKFRWRHHHQVRKLRARKAAAKISMLKAVNVNVPSITFMHRISIGEDHHTETFTATAKKVTLNIGLSHPDRTPLHKQWFGRSSAPGDPLIADVYSAQLGVEQITLDRTSSGAFQDHLRVVALGAFNTDVLISQWPTPWLEGPSFLSGDANSHFLISQVSLHSIEITERLEVLGQLLNSRKPSKPSAPAEPHPLLPALLSPVPRISFGLHVGDVCVRLIGSEHSSPFAMEARTSGFMASVDTHFQMLPDSRFPKILSEPDRPRLQMHINARSELHRTFLSINRDMQCSIDDAPSAIGGSVYPGEPVLSLESIELVAKGFALGEYADQEGGAVTIDVPSTFLYSQCSTEAVSIELWQPDAMAALKATLATFADRRPPPTQSLPTKPPKYILSSLPTGVSFSLAVGRLMLFVAGPDLAPGEDMNIMRGVAFHTGIGLHYCSVQDRHCVALDDLIPRNQMRLQLSLASELLATAAGGTGAATVSQSERALVDIDVWDAALRDAVATRYVADDPFGVSDVSENYRTKEYLHIDHVSAGAALSGRRVSGLPVTENRDLCAVSVSISRIWGSIHLAHAYNILLAVNTVKNLLPQRNHDLSAPPPPSSPSTMSVTVTCNIDKIQILWKFPLRMKLYMRISGLLARRPDSGLISAGWDSILLSVPLDVERDGAPRVVWEELARLLNWNLTIDPRARPVAINAKGDCGRLRIPFNYVIADLILDINVTLKCMKHLVRMIPTGEFTNPPTPEAEDAKIMPNLTIQLGCLTAEAEDEAFEAQLGLIWRTGIDATRLRMEREDAFEAKVATILRTTREDPPTPARDMQSEFQFTPEHTVSIEDARVRLQQVHSWSWLSRVKQAQIDQVLRQEHVNIKLAPKRPLYENLLDELVPITPPPSLPPLVRFAFDDLNLRLSGPSFSLDQLPEFLFKEGGGMPIDMEYSLLVPLHLRFSASSLGITCREYPLPLLHIPAHSDKTQAGLTFDSDIVIAEEMGTDNSVEWVDCAVVRPHRGIHGASPLFVAVPKTIMPVKTYANPTIRVTTDNVTDFAWGVSYGPVIQDIMRVVDTLSHAPRDSSPPIGFWDKLRLVFHWKLRMTFEQEVHLHLKGSHDPHSLAGSGAGFALCWEGNPQLLINHENEQKELVQLTSETVFITVPNTEQMETPEDWKPRDPNDQNMRLPTRTVRSRKARDARKICAKFGSGSRFGVGVMLERSCVSGCPHCEGDAFHRSCRFFDFKPHYEVKLERKINKPLQNSADDSYGGFRSDFIHLSISLTSALQSGSNKYSSIYLSPSVFAHFWAWWTLFDGKSLPIRQGRRYKHKRPLSPKFGQHLATIKYRIEFPRLFLSHLYMDESRDAWADGVTPFVGVKAMIGRFQADMHQRAQETTITAPDGSTKTTVHKPFYAVEVVMKDIELRALLAIFQEPLKSRVPLDPSRVETNYRNKDNIPQIEAGSPWIDMDDFVDWEWTPSGTPALHFLPAASCPRFTYFKRAYLNTMKDRVEHTKFGDEDTHVCFLGKEASVPRIQMDLAMKRINELRSRSTNGKDTHASPDEKPTVDNKYMISLLEDYANHLRTVDAESRSTPSSGPLTYYMPAETVSSDEWAEFDNVYQVHCPNLYMDNIIRDIMLQYYHCSRARKGFEYHMATRAVKFIRDQALAAIDDLQKDVEQDKHKGPAASAQAAAAQAVRKILGGGENTSGGRTSIDITSQPDFQNATSKDPMRGWSDGVSLRKSHFCLLLKPQVVLRSEASAESVCILAAVQGKMQSYRIMDDANADDPISGKVMSRNFASITGLQAFSPSAINKFNRTVVPLEVLIDLRCGSNYFDRLVPQTDASFQYDKFNRLRLQNNVTTVARKSTEVDDSMHNHLQSQNDLIRLHVPRFTVSANDRHFQAISNIVTNLVLFSDAAHKMRSDRLERMLFSYDFTNLASAADVIEKLQSRLRLAVETRREAETKLYGRGETGEIERLKIEAHILLLAEELDYVFEAIKLAQDKADGQAAQKSALMLHASSSEISWRMIDRHDQLLAKLAVRDIDFRWLNRQDSSTVNNLAVGDLQAFDGAADAEWTEILSKYDEPSTHPLVKRKLFCVADWTVLPPVGGITIYQNFELLLHPMRLQIDARVGRRIMEYLWPSRRRSNTGESPKDDTPDDEELQLPPSAPPSPVASRSPLPVLSPRSRSPVSTSPTKPGTMLVPPRRMSEDLPSPTLSSTLVVPTLRKTATSRSFTDLRKAAADSLQVPGFSPRLQRTRSSDALITLATSSSSGQVSKASDDTRSGRKQDITDDAAVMKTRSSQKTFVWVKVSSLHLLLSIQKEDSFLCRDARIRTRDLEYRNQTWSFEELVDQFIPSGKNWKGWVKMAFQQPLVPVLPVAREIISKTKWVSRGHHGNDTPKRNNTPKSQTREGSLIPKRLRTLSTPNRLKKSQIEPSKTVTGLGLVADPEPIPAVPPLPPMPPIPTEETDDGRRHKRNLLRVFKRRRSKSQPRSSVDSMSSVSTSSSWATDASENEPRTARPALNHTHTSPNA